jgi:hypothetical protein
VLLLLLAAAVLQIGAPLPTLQGDYLSKRKATLPADAKGKYALLAFGFSYDSRIPVEAWGKEFDRRFKNNPKITLYEIPMIGGLSRLGAPFIDSGMRRGTPKEKHENVITVYGGTGPWKKMLNVQDEKAAYMILLDPNGIVRWISPGHHSDAKFAEIEKLITQP